MAELIHVKGPEGVEIYSGEYFTEKSAKESYLVQHGYEADSVSVLSFDMIEKAELQKFINFGLKD